MSWCDEEVSLPHSLRAKDPVNVFHGSARRYIGANAGSPDGMLRYETSKSPLEIRKLVQATADGVSWVDDTCLDYRARARHRDSFGLHRALALFSCCYVHRSSDLPLPEVKT